MIAEKHPAEAARVAALRRYDILDTPRESDFDDIVALASLLCEVPISVVNLIDAHRQWFKAEVGLGVRETPLDSSICAHVILESDFVEIPDTLGDSRMADNPLCTADPGLRFYAGALLRTADGYPIGTLCVLDNEPRNLTPVQREVLRVLARQVMTQLDLRAQLARGQILQREIDHRVKNSLQTVGAFVRLARRDAVAQEAKAVLGSVGQQIDTVALLHEQLAMDTDGGTVELSSYLGRVVGFLDAAVPANISISGRFDDLLVDARHAASLATIVNELAANAVKHAFGPGGGSIVFAGDHANTGNYTLTCRDSGAGAGSQSPAGTGLGLRIMQAAVSQLSGTMTSEQTPGGYVTTLTLPMAN